MNKYGYTFLKEKYLQGESLSSIGRQYHCAPVWLRNKLKVEGINPPAFGSQARSGRKYQHNDTCFEKIDTEEKAYWLGFLYADGSCHPSRGLVVISLAEKDKEHLDSFRKFISPENKLEYLNKTKAYRLSIYDKKIHRDLVHLGCIPNKSLVLKFPTNNVVPDEFLHHFIRGYFDGDGCIHVNLEKKVYHFNVISSESFLTDLQTWFHQTVKGYTITKLQNKGRAKCLMKGSKKQVLSLFEYLYKNAHIYLERKCDKFKTILSPQ